MYSRSGLPTEPSPSYYPHWYTSYLYGRDSESVKSGIHPILSGSPVPYYASLFHRNNIGLWRPTPRLPYLETYPRYTEHFSPISEVVYPFKSHFDIPKPSDGQTSVPASRAPSSKNLSVTGGGLDGATPGPSDVADGAAEGPHGRLPPLPRYLAGRDFPWVVLPYQQDFLK